MVEVEKKILEVKEKPKIALLEDSEYVAMTLKDFLEENNFEVYHASSGTDEWLEKLKEEGVKHFLLDVEQERQPLGFQFAEKVKKEIENPNIMMMSANEEHKNKALKNGYEFFEKPFSLEYFLEFLKQKIEKMKSR